MSEQPQPEQQQQDDKATLAKLRTMLRRRGTEATAKIITPEDGLTFPYVEILMSPAEAGVLFAFMGGYRGGDSRHQSRESFQADFLDSEESVAGLTFALCLPGDKREDVCAHELSDLGFGETEGAHALALTFPVTDLLPLLEQLGASD